MAKVILAQAVPCFYEVRCAACGDPLPAPETEMGRTAWTPQEAKGYPEVVCHKCGCVQRASVPLIVPAT